MSILYISCISYFYISCKSKKKRKYIFTTFLEYMFYFCEHAACTKKLFEVAEIYPVPTFISDMTSQWGELTRATVHDNQSASRFNFHSLTLSRLGIFLTFVAYKLKSVFFLVYI